MKRLVLICALALASTPAISVEPGEVLADPALEARARALSKELRCLVCQNESIDESNAELAKDLRLLVRERLVAGDTDEEAMAFIVARYGEFVLLRPGTGGANWLLWASGPLMLILAGGVAAGFLRTRAKAGKDTPDPLSDEEQARLKRILDD